MTQPYATCELCETAVPEGDLEPRHVLGYTFSACPACRKRTGRDDRDQARYPEVIRGP